MAITTLNPKFLRLLESVALNSNKVLLVSPYILV
ncbi:hypothetical protein BH09BAC5_BH09BAC5_08410 [soil metagenome]